MPEAPDFVNSVVQMGLAGLIIYVLLRPLIFWFMKRSDEKDAHINALVEKHLKHDEERHVILMKALEELPTRTSIAIMRSLKEIYPPEEYGRKGYERYAPKNS